MKIALAQMNATLGDFAGNAKKIVSEAQRACKENCDIVVFPEMSLFGYHPGDLLERKSVVDQQNKILQQMLGELPDKVCLLYTSPSPRDRQKSRMPSSA